MTKVNSKHEKTKHQQQWSKKRKMANHEEEGTCLY